jgi:hypothetical protein
MQKVTIERSKWARGGGEHVCNNLLNEFLRPEDAQPEPFQNGSMCCLGFLCRALGATAPQIKNKPMAAEAVNEMGVDFRKDLAESLAPLVEINPTYNKYAGRIVYTNSAFAEGAASINDDDAKNGMQREDELTQLFAQNGFELTFVD